MGDAFDEEIERFFDALPGVLAAAPHSHVGRARAWRNALFDAGLAGFGIPVEYGGRAEPTDGARFADLPPAATKAKNYAAWQKDFGTWLYQTQKLSILRSPATGLTSNAGESERDFRTRLQQGAREQRDAVAETLRQKYAPKLAALQERLRRAQQAVERQQAEAAQQKIGTIVSIGATLVEIGRAHV